MASFNTPVSGVQHNYGGVVDVLIEMIMCQDVRFIEISVIEHPTPFFLVDADVICGGCKLPSWNYEGMSLLTDGKTS